MTVEVLVIKEIILSTRLRDNQKKRKEFKRLKVGKVQVKQCFSTQQDYYTHELTRTMADYTRPFKNQASQNSSMGEGRAHTFPFQTLELLTTDGFWEKESQCSTQLQSLVGQPCSSQESHTHECTRSTNQTLCILRLKTQDMKEVGMMLMGRYGRSQGEN